MGGAGVGGENRMISAEGAEDRGGPRRTSNKRFARDLIPGVDVQ